MIENGEQLDQAVQQLGRMSRALAAIRSELADRSPRQFALLAEGPIDELRQLRAAIDAYTGESVAREFESDVWMRIQGHCITWPDAPTSVLTALLDSFRKGIQAVTEFLATGQLTTRPTAELKRACDMQVVAFESGSLCVGVQLPVEAQLSLDYADALLVREALTKFLAAAAWVGSDGSFEDLELQFSDTTLRRVLLNSLKPFLPRARGAVNVVELSGRAVVGQRPIQLARHSVARVDRAIDRIARESVETHVGVLREIDLDSQSLTLRNPVGEEPSSIRCQFSPEMLEAAKSALDQTVSVTGVRQVVPGRRGSSSIRLTRLEVLDASEPAARTDQ